MAGHDVVHFHTARAHALALDHLLSRPEDARDMGEAGRRAVMAGLAFETQAARLTALYREVLGG